MGHNRGQSARRLCLLERQGSVYTSLLMSSIRYSIFLKSQFLKIKSLFSFTGGKSSQKQTAAAFFEVDNVCANATIPRTEKRHTDKCHNSMYRIF